MGFLCGLFLGKRARDLWRRGGCAEARVRKCFWSKVKRNCITWPSWSSTWATTLTTVVDHKFVTVEKKKKKKKVKMPKTWVVAKDMPVTVLWNYDLFAAEGHWSWPFPEACCLPRSQDRRVYIYICMYVHGHDFDFRGVRRILGDILRLESFQGDWRLAACVVSKRFVQYKICKWIFKLLSARVKKNWNWIHLSKNRRRIYSW